jgi:SAM-dependent methyltransferase
VDSAAASCALSCRQSVAARHESVPLYIRLGRLYGRMDGARGNLAMRLRYSVPPEVARELPQAELARRLGIRTGEVWPEGGERFRHVPSPWGILRRILRTDEVSSTDVFLDFGCGAGRMLLEAAGRYPFQRVIGVDIVPELLEVAGKLLTDNRDKLRCQTFELVRQDSAEFRVPDDVTVAYFYDPFRGSLFQSTLANLVASVERNPRRVRIIYLTPSEISQLQEMPRARFVRYGKHGIRRWRPASYLVMYELDPASD